MIPANQSETNKAKWLTRIIRDAFESMPGEVSAIYLIGFFLGRSTLPQWEVDAILELFVRAQDDLMQAAMSAAVSAPISGVQVQQDTVVLGLDKIFMRQF